MAFPTLEKKNGSARALLKEKEECGLADITFKTFSWKQFHAVLANRSTDPSGWSKCLFHGRAETDTETDKETETVQLVSTDARVVCHLPRLNTHTLTLSIHPGHDPPTLQKSVEQLLHLICHLHAKVSHTTLPF